MGMDKRRPPRRKAAVVGVIAALAAAGSASAAFQALPPGDQVNNDLAAGINPNLPVNTEDPANSDVVGGSLVATKPLVPWAIFRQTEPPGKKDQIFSRSFAVRPQTRWAASGRPAATAPSAAGLARVRRSTAR